jgi:hypothetical protein
LFDGSTWTMVQNWTSSNTFTWTPMSPGTSYRVGVWIRNGGSTADAYANPSSNGSIPFSVTSGLVITSLTANPASPQPVGTPVTFTSVATGGTAPYQYKWWLFEGSTWTVVQNWTSSNTFAWTPTSSGTGYRVGVWIRNAGSTADTYDNPLSNGSIPFSVTGGMASGLVMTSLTANPASPQAAGTPVTFTAMATGGTAPYQYKWWVFDGSTWTAMQNWTSSNTFTWTPASPGTGYRVGVWIRNAGRTADAYDNPSSNGSIPFSVS